MVGVHPSILCSVSDNIPVHLHFSRDRWGKDKLKAEKVPESSSSTDVCLFTPAVELAVVQKKCMCMQIQKKVTELHNELGITALNISGKIRGLH